VQALAARPDFDHGHGLLTAVLSNDGRVRRAEVAVVGAGVTGLSIAWHLRRRDAAVIVLERAGIAAGASGVQPGGVRQQWGTAVNCRLARESLDFYRRATELLDGPIELRFTPCGYLFLAHSEPALARLAANARVQAAAGVPSRIVSAERAAELVPGLGVQTVAGASWCAEDGYVDRPQSLIEALARGTDVVIGDVAGIERDGGWRLTTAAGESVAADAVVVAAGVDTPALLERLGIDPPIEPESRWLFLSDPIRERLLEPLVVSTERHFAAKQLANGRVLASDLSATGPSDADAPRWRSAVRAAIRELLPRLEHLDFTILTEGVYDVTPDRQAIIGPVDEGLWIAAGFSGHGFMLAPAVGRIVAEALAGDGEDEALAILDPGRFAEGRLVPEPQVV
jgi:glycine/D-amino acid oxidase-like deaminating enzyme